MPSRYIALSNNSNHPFRLANYSRAKKGDLYFTPFPDLWGISGLHFSVHRDGTSHIRTTKKPIIDVPFDPSSLRTDFLPKIILRSPEANQPLKVFLLKPYNYLRQITKPLDDRKLVLDTSLLSQSMIEVDMDSSTNLVTRMDSLRHQGIASNGDIALITGLESGEVSLYNYGLGMENQFRTFRIDIESLGKLPIVNRLQEPLNRVIHSLPEPVKAGIPQFPKIEPSYYFQMH